MYLTCSKNLKFHLAKNVSFNCYPILQNTYVSLSRAQLEFPRENLQLGVDLDEGQFGKVIQARAMNITGNGKWQAVAVKTCRC